MSLKGKEPYGCISGVNYGAKLAPPAKKLEAPGEYVGCDWDDGVNDNVRMITVTHDGYRVKSVKFEYAYGTKTVVGDVHGYANKDDKKEEFMFNLEKEYITSVQGHYGKKLPRGGPDRALMEAWNDDGITMLKFNTNLSTYRVLETDKPGYEYVGTTFEMKEEGHKIVGFYGRASACLSQICVYVKPIDDA